MARSGFLRSALSSFSRSSDTTLDNELFFSGGLWSSPSATGIMISQQTALQATAVMACVSCLSEDVSKMTPSLYRRMDVAGYKDGGREKVTNHPLAILLHRPNDWQTWPEFCRQMTVGFLMRGNGYAVIVRNRRGVPVMWVPINPDRVALWESPSGALFWMVTRAGLHEMAVLQNEPYLIPYDDVFHVKDLTANGLIGMSRIALAREAIGLALGQEQQYARLMGNGARPSGILSSDKNMTPEQAERNKTRWNEAHGGLLRSGGTAVLEAGLKWTPLSLSAVDLQFLELRQFQLGEICRMFRVPPHMIGVTEGAVGTMVQQSQDYLNKTLTSHTDIWEKRFDFQFDLDGDRLEVDFDEEAMLKADLPARYNAHRIGIMTEFLERNEARIKEKMNPTEEGRGLRTVTTASIRETETVDESSATPGSDLTGDGPDGAGKPSEDGKKIPSDPASALGV